MLRSLALQTRRPDETIIVDAGDDESASAVAAEVADGLRCAVLRSVPDLCRQRNMGVRTARGAFVLLCDDDLEFPRDYVQRLLAHLESEQTLGAATGVWLERTPDGTFSEGFPTPSARHLLFAFTFQLTVWGDVESVVEPRFLAGLVRAVKDWYRRRGNSWSLAGWPLVTQVRAPGFLTAIYSLGAALVRRDWLLASPFDEVLGAHGIGDNYGVAIGFPRCPGVFVLTDLEVLHHRAPEGRLAPDEVYFERILALHHFVRGSPRFTPLTTVFLIWSLIGSAASFLIRGRVAFARRALRAIGVIATGRNPLDRAIGAARIPEHAP